MNVAAGSETVGLVVLSDTSFPPHPTLALPNASITVAILSMISSVRTALTPWQCQGPALISV